jgi:hypothetical protein
MKGGARVVRPTIQDSHSREWAVLFAAIETISGLEARRCDWNHILSVLVAARVGNLVRR